MIYMFQSIQWYTCFNLSNDIHVSIFKYTIHIYHLVANAMWTINLKTVPNSGSPVNHSFCYYVVHYIPFNKLMFVLCNTWVVPVRVLEYSWKRRDIRINWSVRVISPVAKYFQKSSAVDASKSVCKHQRVETHKV